VGERTRLGLGVFGVALVLGSLGDILLRATPWGINFLIWVTVLVGLTVFLAKWRRVGTRGEGKWLVFVALVFAAGVVLRDSPVVVFLDLVGVLISLSLAVWLGRSGSLRRAGILDYALGGDYTGALTSAGPIPVSVVDIEWREAVRGRWKGQALAVSRGVLLAAPLLLLFGTLLVAADAIFERLIIEVFGFDLAEVFSHLFLIIFFAWITAGLLWAGLMARVPENFAIPRPGVLSLGIVEVGIVLTLLDLLFLTFVVIQVRYLFGGAGRVAATAGLTYAEYARRGFFELVTVTALALPLLLIAHWLLRTETHERLFKALAGIMVVLLFVVVASALQRMYLYQQAFGLTELRLYTTIFMAWISAVLLWFVLTVLRARRDRFAFGALLAGFAAIFAINAMNPDALIASTNIDRMEEGKRFDAYYLSTLSADAVPVLVESLPEIGDTNLWKDYTVERAIVDRWDTKQPDWRTWNLGRSRARQSVRSYVEDQAAGRAPGIASVGSRHQDRAFMHRSDRVIHNMLWIKSPKRGISGSSVTSRHQVTGYKFQDLTTSQR
jgi:hypothetical protein